MLLSDRDAEQHPEGRWAPQAMTVASPPAARMADERLTFVVTSHFCGGRGTITVSGPVVVPAGSAGDQFVGGVVEQCPLKAGQVQGLVQVGVCFQRADIASDAEVVPPQLLGSEVCLGEGLVQQPGLLSDVSVEHGMLLQSGGRRRSPW